MSELLVVTIGYAISIAVGLGFGAFVLSRDWRSVTHRLFFLMCLSLAGFQISFVLGANTADPSLAYWFWFANISDIFLAAFYLHFIVLALHAFPRFKWIVASSYAVGLAILIACILYPAAFLPRVVPKLYFKTYLDGGPLYAVMLGFFLLVIALSFVVMFLERRTQSVEGKRRTDYHVFALFYGTATGVTAFPLVFDIPFDPIVSALIGTFVIPMVYGMIKKDLLDIRLVARRTVIFTAMIVLITATMSAVSLLSSYLSTHVPGFSYWVVPVFTAVVATLVGYLYWKKGEEAEFLKYEFINISTHKFRTPLTRIRWATEALLARADLPAETRETAVHIRDSTMDLIQLSTLLMDAVRIEKEHYAYTYTIVSLRGLVEDVLASFKIAISDKRISLTIDASPDLPPIRVDRDRLSSVVHVLIENAINYTPVDGTIRITFTGYTDAVRFEIKDSGIGIGPDEKARLFVKFYRSDRARRADTEGVGIGLSIAKNIIERHRGTLGATSEGIGKGSTFWFTLPVRVG